MTHAMCLTLYPVVSVKKNIYFCHCVIQYHNNSSSKFHQLVIQSAQGIIVQAYSVVFHYA
jgi:hypothetical protein